MLTACLYNQLSIQADQLLTGKLSIPLPIFTSSTHDYQFKHIYLNCSFKNKIYTTNFMVGFSFVNV